MFANNGWPQQSKPTQMSNNVKDRQEKHQEPNVQTVSRDGTTTGIETSETRFADRDYVLKLGKCVEMGRKLRDDERGIEFNEGDSFDMSSVTMDVVSKQTQKQIEIQMNKNKDDQMIVEHSGRNKKKGDENV